MTGALETAAIVALLQASKRPWHEYSDAIESDRGALRLLEQEHGLLAGELIERQRALVERWRSEPFELVTVLDPEYPENLRAVHDRPPLIFVAGRLLPADARAVAVIGSRQASAGAAAHARDLARHLVRERYTVVSGLARGIDAAAHRQALASGGRTLAVIGTGLRHCYPPEHAALQHEISERGAVISQFLPDAPPSRTSFPLRNAVMSGLSLATVIVEAGQTSGARIQARRALAHGRPVFVRAPLLEQGWAQELARRPGTHVYESPDEITATVARLTSAGALTG